MGKSKKIPPPESTEGGFIKPSDKPGEDSPKTDDHAEKNADTDMIDGGFITDLKKAN